MLLLLLLLLLLLSFIKTELRQKVRRTDGEASRRKHRTNYTHKYIHICHAHNAYAVTHMNV